MKLNHTLLMLLLLLISTHCLFGQERTRRTRKEKINQRFAAGLIAGVNVSQVHGDTQSGFDKRGITGGIKVITQLNPYVKFNVELLYVEKGSKLFKQNAAFPGVKLEDRFLSMRFIEIPVLLNFNVKQDSKIFLEGGFSVGRMISSEIKDDSEFALSVKLREIEPEFTSSEASFLFGFGISFTKNVSLSTRFSYALTDVYADPHSSPRVSASNPKEISYLRNYSWHLMLSYNIF